MVCGSSYTVALDKIRIVFPGIELSEDPSRMKDESTSDFKYE